MGIPSNIHEEKLRRKEGNKHGRTEKTEHDRKKWWQEETEIGWKVKGKAIPLEVWTGPEGSRRLRLPDFKTIGTWRW